MATEQIVIEYIAQVEGLKAQLKTVQSELKKVDASAKDSAKATTDSFKGVGDSIKNVAVGIASSLGLAFSVQKVAQFAQASIKAFEDSEEVAKKLEFAVTKIGKEGQAAFEKLNKQADIFAKKTIFDDESIRSAQTMLIQFGLNSDAVEDLIPKIIDLASATGQDLQSATQLAIQGINGQGRALKPYGIILDDTGSKTHNLAILTEGLTKFTGSAGEAFNTAAGQAKFFDNEINELQESIGAKLSPAWNTLKIAALNSINAIADDLADLLGMTDGGAAQFQRTLQKFESLSAENQTKILFDLAQKGTQRTEIEQKLYIEFKKIQLQRLEAADDGAKEEIGLTQKGIDEKIAAEKKAADDLKKITEDHIKDVEGAEKQARKDVEEGLKENVDLEKKLAGEVRDAEIDATKEATAEASRLYDEDVENKKKAAKEKQEIVDAGFEITSQSANALFEYQNNLDDQKMNRLKEDLDSGVILQDEYDVKVAAIKKKAAERDKQQAIFNIILATAQAVISALASIPPNVPLSIVAAVTGAAQLAVATTTAIPKFAEGVIGLQGGIAGKDSIPAILMPGESIMTTEETQRHGELLRSIRNKSLDEYLMDNYINPKLSDILNNSTADNMAKSAKLNGLNEYSLSRVMSRNKGVNVQNADYLAKAIAKEINKGKLNAGLWS